MLTFVNWSSFVPDLVIALISTALAVTVALTTYFHQQSLKNRQLVCNLADDLSMRRAFALVEPRVGSGGDADRCFRSVEAAQHRIAEIRDEIAPNHDLRQELQQLVFACVTYKSSVEVEPRRWVFALMRLRGDLVLGLSHIEKLMKLPPGSLPAPGTAQ